MGRGDSDQQADGGIGDGQAEHAAAETEHDAFHQQLARDVAPSRSESRADREFMLAAFDPNQQQVGDVGARDQEHDSDGSHQHPKSF